MFVSVPNKSLRRQEFSTSCWISSSHFVLQYLDVDVSLQTLHGKFYNPDPKSAMAMSGAGHPSKILGEYAFDAGRFPATIDPRRVPTDQVIAAIAGNISDGIPVIAGVRSQQVKGFGHAVVITAISPETGTLAFKDPATGTTPRPFGVDIRTYSYSEFLNGFSYRYAKTMQLNVFAYCSQIIYLRPAGEMSLFD